MDYNWAEKKGGQIYIGIDREYLEEFSDALEGQGFKRKNNRWEPYEIFDYKKSDPDSHITIHYMVDDEVATMPIGKTDAEAEEFADAAIHGHKVGEKMLPQLYDEVVEELE